MFLDKLIELEEKDSTASERLCFTSQGASETESSPSFLVIKCSLEGSDHGVAQLTDTEWHLQSGQGMFGLQTWLG